MSRPHRADASTGPSVLQPETRRILATVRGERTIPQETAEDRAAWGETRKWLEGRPHVDYCRCAECRGKAAAE